MPCKTFRRIHALHVGAAIAGALLATTVHAAPQVLYFQGITANDPSGEWLRIGAHVQAFAGGYSESFVNAPAVSVPEPGSHALLLAGLGLLACPAPCRKGAASGDFR